MTDQEILENAPEGATDFDNNNDYWDLRMSNDHNKVWLEDDDTWVWFSTDEEPSAYGLRPLADIKRIVELQKRIEELEILTEVLASQSQIRDLEQQAKGIEDAVRLTMMDYRHKYSIKLLSYCRKLREKSNQLKGDE